MSTSGQQPTGVIFEIQRWSINDGPGIRTVVFLKGCPLRCRWCCNPESWTDTPQLAVFAERCTGCGRCAAACPLGIALPATAGAVMDRGACAACGLCAAACPAGARQIMGKTMTPGAVLEVVKRDRIFYRQSGGGVTFSGGEAFRQTDFLRDLAQGCRSLGLHTAAETSGYFPWEQNVDIVRLLDLVILDLKHMDPEVHRSVTGVTNRIILENARRISAEGISLLIRVPVIPTVNDSVENIRATARFVAEDLDSALGMELLPYHSLGKGKYGALGLDHRQDGLQPAGKDSLELLRTVVAAQGVCVLRSHPLI